MDFVGFPRSALGSRATFRQSTLLEVPEQTDTQGASLQILQ